MPEELEVTVMASLVPLSPFLALGLEFLRVLATARGWNTFPDSLI